MKKRIGISILLLAAVLGSLQAEDVNITFDGKQKLYFNSRPSWIPDPQWDSYGAVFSAYFYGDNGNQFAGQAEQIDGTTYAVVVPEGTWHHVIFTRHAPGTTTFDFDPAHGFWSESQSISLKQYQWDNYISEFNIKGDGTDPYCIWNQLYSEQPKNGVSPASLASDWGLTIENISVCDNSTGDPFTLTPNTIDLGGGKYEYNYDMRAHAWFKTTNNGATWTNVDGKAGIRASSDEGEMNYDNEIVGAKNSTTYYYLYAKEADDQRLICVQVNKNCDISCEITSFEVTPTAVNVGNNTYTMDGVVAFTKAEGSLIVECDGKKVTIFSPESPQPFSLEGLSADGKPETFRAYFSAKGSCEMYKETTAPLPTKDATTHPDKTIAPLDNITLTPDADGSGDGWEWTLGDTFVKKSPAADNSYAVPTMDHDGEVTYVYTEYNPLPTLPTNLMDNGSFEDVTIPFKWHTEYKNSNVLNGNKIWDGSDAEHENIYDLAAFTGTYGYFGVTTNANTYWRLMAHRSPKDGAYMAVIDGDEVANKQAWYAATVDNPNLKLMRGTSYLFSFWVANINNFGELINNGRKNCAKLQFHIKCHSSDDGLLYEADLGEPIDLNDDKYMDFNWHQNSSTFSTRAYFGKDFNADDVTISVVDKNNTGLTIGNDFALDDIRFRAISVVSKSIKAREFFTVKFYEPPTVVEKPVVTITQTPACGMNDFAMSVQVDYSTLNDKFPVSLQLTDNVYGPLSPAPIVIDPATNPNSITIPISTAMYSQWVADGANHTITATITRIDGAGVDKGGSNSATYTAPGVPAINTPVLTELNKACDKTTFDLKIETEYKAFKGTKLHFDWDGAEWTDAISHAISYKEATWQKSVDTLKNLVADGKNHTLRVYTDNATLDCEYTFSAITAPYMPNIKVVTTTVLHEEYDCSSTKYKVKVEAEFENGQGHNIIFKDWNGGTEQNVATNVADSKASYTFTYDWETPPASHEYNVYFEGAKNCDHKKSYTAPAQPALAVAPSYTATGCDITAYTLQLNLTYTNQRGSQFFAKVDEGTLVSVANPNVGAQTEKTDVTLNIADLPADGKNHTYSVWTDETKDCSLSDVTFTAPYQPQIASVTSEVQPYQCGDAGYQVKVTVNHASGQDHDLIITDEEGHAITLHSTDATYASPATCTFDMPWEPVANHTFKAYFVDAESCKDNLSHLGTYTKPVEPVISVAAPTFEDKDCDKDTYTLKTVVTYTNQDGTLYAWLDDDTANKKSFAYNQDQTTSDDVTINLTGLVGDGAAHNLNIEFDGTKGCRRVVADNNAVPFTAPFTPVISGVTITPDPMTCSATTYTVTVAATLSANANGRTLTVTGDTGTEPTTYVISGTSFTHQFTVNRADATGKFRIYFAEAVNCESQKTKDYTYTVPTVPGLSVNTVTAPKPDCDVTTFDLSISGTYSNLHGDQLEFLWDGVQKATQSITPLSSGAIAATITGIAYDGKTHVLTVQSNNTAYDNCPEVQNVPVPFSPAISGETATPTQMKCGDTSYDVEVAFTVANGQGKTVTVTGKGQNQNITAVDGANKVTFTNINVSDATPDRFEIWFADNTDCTTHKVATYPAPTVPGLSVNTVTVPTPACDVTAFDLNISGTYSNLHGDQLEFLWDGVKKTTQSITPLSSGAVAATITGIVYDGKTHVLQVQSNNTVYDNCPEVQNILVPFSPAISGETATPTQMKCGDTSYDVEVAFTVANGQGKNVTVTGKGQNQDVTAVDGVNKVTFTNINVSDVTPDQFEIWFADNTDCTTHKVATYPAPTVPGLSVNTVTVPTPDCDVTAFDLNISGTYSNLHGDQLEFLWDGVKTATQSITPLSSGAVAATITGIVYDGKTHVLQVQSNDGVYDNCPETQNILVPFSPAISGETATPTQMKCGDTSYDVEVAFTVANGQGKNVTVTGKGQNQDVTAVDGVNKVTFTNISVSDATPDQFEIWFADNTDCTTHKVATYPAPTVPGLSVNTVTVPTPACDVTTFDLSISGTYSNLHGDQLEFLWDGVKKTTQSITPLSSGAVAATITGIAYDGKTHVLQVQSNNTVYDNCPEVQNIAVPFSPSISGETATPTQMKCGDTSYDVEVAFTVANGQGKTVTVTGKGQNQNITAVDGANKVTFTNINVSDATPDRFEIWFADNTDCTTHKVATYPAPTVPGLSVNTVTVPTPACDVTAFDLNISGTYSNLHGDQLEFLWDGVKTATQSITPLSSGAVAATITGIVYDGKTHVLQVQSNDGVYDNCPEVQNIAVPFSPSISGETATPTQMKCGDTSYDVEVVFTVANGQGKNVTVTGKGQTQNVTAVDGINKVTFTNINVSDATPDQFEIWFADNTDCTNHKVVTYTAPTVPGLSVNTVTAPTPDCDVTTFDLNISGTYSNLHGDQLEFLWDGVKKATQSITPLFSGAVAATITGITYDGKTHVLTVQSNDGVYDNCPEVQNVPVPFSPSISGETATPTQMKCGDTSYDVEVAFTVANGQGKNVTVTGKGQNQNITAVDGVNKVTFININVSDATPDQFEIWFADNTDCTTHKVVTYTKPVEPKLENIVTNIPTIVACDATTFDMSVTFDYTNQDGTLDVNVDDTFKATIKPAFVPNSTTSQTVTATFTGLPADGTTSRKLNIVFVGGIHSCDPVQIPFDAPYPQAINTMTITSVPKTVPCGTKEYAVAINLTTQYNAIGEQIKLSYKDKSGLTDTTVTVKYPDNANAAGTKIAFNLVLHNMDASPQTIEAAFVDAPACSVSAKYTPPTSLSCNKEYITICEGDSYFWPLTGAYYTAKVGTDTYTNPLNVKDTLFLTGIELPKISIGTMAVTCDDESTIRIPFTGTTGVADSIDIAIGTNNYIGSIVGSDIVFTRAAELVAGDYSAVVTIGTKGYSCNQVVPVQFSVALGGVMYRKWTDVLFVSNADNLFVAYQWYENGLIMAGETKQSLYRPEGLPGLYYCQLVTTDGKTITTCEQAFDDVQPSRDESTQPAKVRSTTLYDPMGHSLQTRPNQGIYIVFEELENGETRAYKIGIYE